MNFLSQFDAFHDLASKATGLDDFGGVNYREPMRLLLADYDEHARFSRLGMDMVSSEIVGRLTGLLMTQEGIKVYPASAKARITKPLVIIGMPRTGTTVLHKLLSQDPTVQTLPIWLGCAPMPRPPRSTWESNPYFQQVKWGVEQLFVRSPELRNFHPMSAENPDECRFGFNHSFWSPDAAASAIVPNYADWVLNGDARYAYLYYQRLLGLIAGDDCRRWLLKDVCHLAGLNSFLEVFPDACIVQTHRDPIISLTSVASLILLLRQMREEQPDPIEHGEMILNTWGKALDKAERVRKSHNQAQFFDVHNEELQVEPVRTIERIYEYFGLPVSEEARLAWIRRAAEDPKSGHGFHQYAPTEFGFTPELIAASIGEYYQRYQSTCASPHAIATVASN